MNVNDHKEHGNDETALKRAQLKKVEDAIEHEERSLASLREVRDALRAELNVPTVIEEPEAATKKEGNA